MEGTPGETKAQGSEKRAQGPWVNGQHMPEPPPTLASRVYQQQQRGSLRAHKTAQWILGVRFPEGLAAGQDLRACVRG